MATIKKPTGPQGGSSALVVLNNKQAEKPATEHESSNEAKQSGS